MPGHAPATIVLHMVRKWVDSISALDLPRALCAAAIAVGATLALFHLGQKSLWRDEIFSVMLAESSWGDFWSTTLSSELNMSLYHLLLRPWLSFAETDAAIRGLSTLFAIAAVPSLYILGSELFNRMVGGLASFLLAINAFFIEYAQEARSYSLVMLLAILSTLFFYRAMRTPSRASLLLYVVTTALAVYAHFFALLVILAQGISLAALPRSKVPWGSLRRAGGALAVLLVPMAAFVLLRDVGQLDWVPPPVLDDLRLVLRDLSGNGGTLLLVAYFIPSAVFVLRLIADWRGYGRSVELWTDVLILAWLAAPIAISFGASFIKPVFVSRYFIIVLPALALMVAVGISRVRVRWLMALVLGGFVVLAAVGLDRWYGGHREDWRGAAAFVVDNARPGDLVLLGPTGDPIVYYLRSALGSGEIDVVDLPEEGSLPAARLVEITMAGQRPVWYVARFDLWNQAAVDVARRDALLAALDAYPAVQAREFPGRTSEITVARHLPGR